MNAWEQLIGNRILMSAVTGWFVAQLLKTIIHTLMTKKFDSGETDRIRRNAQLPFLHRLRYGHCVRASVRLLIPLPSR